VQWSSSNTAVATVDANGVITGVAQGNANITALSETITATFSIVVASQVSTVTLWPTLLTVDEGNQAALHASALDLNGTEVPGTTPVWTSSDTRVVTVDQNGVVTAVGYGVADVSVTVDGVTVTAQVVVPARVDALTVSPCFLYMKPGDADQLSATLYDPAGMVVNTDISWYSNAPAVVSVSQSGMVTANAPGTALITVTAGAKSRTVYVKVRAPVADIIVPESLMIRAGWEAQLYPILKDEHGNVLTGRIINYSSSNNWVAWVSPSGRIHAQHVGHVHITVESEGVSRVVQVNVYVPKPW
jgi:uncharacterized protein YjdB